VHCFRVALFRSIKIHQIEKKILQQINQLINNMQQHWQSKYFTTIKNPRPIRKTQTTTEIIKLYLFLLFSFFFLLFSFFAKTLKNIQKYENQTQKSVHEFSYRREKHRNEGVQLKRSTQWKLGNLYDLKYHITRRLHKCKRRYPCKRPFKLDLKSVL